MLRAVVLCFKILLYVKFNFLADVECFRLSIMCLTIWFRNAGMDEGIVAGGGVAELSTKQRHQMKHRELFLSRQVETMPATHIRGKCCVTLLNETESLLSYLNKEDSFFYCLVFDPTQRTLLADKGTPFSWFRFFSMRKRSFITVAKNRYFTNTNFCSQEK